MRTNRQGRKRWAPGSRGFTIIEVLVAAILLLVVFFSVALVYMYGRRQTVYEEDRRRASAVAEARLEALRRDYGYDDLPAVNGTTTNFTMDGRTYAVRHVVTAESPQANATTISITVTWNARAGNATISRTLVCTTILARGLPWGT
jgi:Tfp pilus assembly protein PilV